ncbi:MAG: beta-galactosidase [Verrucomicrobia bacterium]|nr:beta-galactosidase [Verrucomicrobiota bacterium]MCH8514633.1 beta-galactosidase [Kiritimatiellia bacterium]
MQKYPPFLSSFPKMAHGGDYNPEQWLESVPDILDQDIRLMRLSGCNTFSVGIFSWARYEPREGEFSFEWMDRILDRLAAADVNVLLATPSAAMPAWMRQKYPEISRVNRDGVRELQPGRMDHCFSSRVFREKVGDINRRLAERYRTHPAVKMWHISNEYQSLCHCEQCVEAFRAWLRTKYGTLENLNRAWWTSFWGQSFQDWGEINPRNRALDGSKLDWKRFQTDQIVDFLKHEIAALREGGATQPATTNMMSLWPTVNFQRLADTVDVIADDCYPVWKQNGRDEQTAASISFVHDLRRSMKGGRPWVLMESCPSVPQWHNPPKLKRPGMARMEMMQAVAHGSDGVLYFQWRKGRGGHEKYHGAVVDHVGHEHTRVFRDVSEIGNTLAKLDDLVGTTTPAEVAFVYDWEVRWALETSAGVLKDSAVEDDAYTETVKAHYFPYWSMGVPVDVLESRAEFSGYRLLVAPRLYLLLPGVADALKTFVENGGTLVLSAYCGQVNESNLCFTGGWPGDGLRELCGIWVEETDRLLPEDQQNLTFADPRFPALQGEWSAGPLCEILHAEGAEVLATYGAQFYAGTPALTRNAFGKGEVWYLATDVDPDFLLGLHRELKNRLKLRQTTGTDLPPGVGATWRTDGESEWVFLQNFGTDSVEISLDSRPHRDVESGETVSSPLHLKPVETRILQRKA